MIEPPPRFSMCAAHNLASRTGANRFRSNCSCHADSGNSASAPGRAPPALLTSTSIPPNFLTVSSTHFCASSGLVTSPTKPIAEPAFVSAATASFNASFVRAQALTCIPSAASACTIATFPVKPKSIWKLLTSQYSARVTPRDGVDAAHRAGDFFYQTQLCRVYVLTVHEVRNENLAQLHATAMALAAGLPAHRMRRQLRCGFGGRREEMAGHLENGQLHLRRRTAIGRYGMDRRRRSLHYPARRAVPPGPLHVHARREPEA